jgi:hypothetical protein
MKAATRFAILALTLAACAPDAPSPSEPAFTAAVDCGTNPHWPAKANSTYPVGTLRYVNIDGIRYVYGVPGRAPTLLWRWLEYEIDARRFTVAWRNPYSGFVAIALTCRVPGFWVTLEPVAVTASGLHYWGGAVVLRNGAAL